MELTQYKVMVKGADTFKCHTTTYDKKDAESIKERLANSLGKDVRIDSKTIVIK